jgi:hypothetical protein
MPHECRDVFNEVRCEGETITNIYDQGWRPGTERVQVVLVFDVAHFDPGETPGIRDVDVR